jgi:hypothetical protein
MILIGFRDESSSTGSGEYDYSVTHQRTDVIAGSPTDTAESLAELYHAMVHKAEQSRRALIDLEDRLDADAFNGCDIGADEYHDLCGKYRADMRILKYDRILISEGIILK